MNSLNKRILIVGADPREFDETYEAVKFTGIGKDSVDKFQELLNKELENGELIAVFNVGTCVAKDPFDVGYILIPARVKMGSITIDTQNPAEFEVDDVTLTTAKEFLTQDSDLQEGVADMEAFYQAEICNKMGIPYQTIKVVTESLKGGTTAEGWAHALKWAKYKCSGVVNRILSSDF